MFSNVEFEQTYHKKPKLGWECIDGAAHVLALGIDLQ